MAPKTCTVTMAEVRGSRHKVEVLADYLFEAAVYGLKLLRENSRVEDEPGPATRLEIRVKSPEVVQQMRVQQITAGWMAPASVRTRWPESRSRWTPKTK